MTGPRLWSPIQLATALGLTDWCDWCAALRNGVIPPPDVKLSRSRPRWRDETVRKCLGGWNPASAANTPEEIIAELNAELRSGRAAAKLPNRRRKL